MVDAYDLPNYILLNTSVPFKQDIAYVDTPEYLADHMFISAGVKVKFLGTFHKEDKEYVIVMIRVPKKYVNAILEALQTVNLQLSSDSEYRWLKMNLAEGNFDPE